MSIPRLFIFGIVFYLIQGCTNSVDSCRDLDISGNWFFYDTVNFSGVDQYSELYISKEYIMWNNFYGVGRPIKYNVSKDSVFINEYDFYFRIIYFDSTNLSIEYGNLDVRRMKRMAQSNDFISWYINSAQLPENWYDSLYDGRIRRVNN
jgi:hypothetical protein